jgi:putative DNA primase/helicase
MAEQLPPDHPMHAAGEGGEQAPQAPESASADSPSPSSALGATAPLDNVVSLAEAAALRRAVEDASPSAAASPPPPPESAHARTDGGGGGPEPKSKAKAGGKKEKTIDFGALNYLTENFTLIYGTDTVWDKAHRIIMKISNMAHAHGADMVRLWKGSERRHTVMPEDVVFDPSETCDPNRCINLYNGLALEPLPCSIDDVDPMLELVWHLCSQSGSATVTVDEVVKQVLRWLALPLQRPGTKLRTALVFHGPQGTGKNLFFDVPKAFYGKHGVMVGQVQLEDKFNDWLSAKILIIGNEVVARQDLFHSKNILKWVITEDEIPIRAMQQAVRWEKNHAAVVFLSNEQMPLVLEDGDRRYLVVYTPLADETGLYQRVRDFIANDGARKWLHFLLNYDLGDFNEHTKPLMTQAKADLIDLSMRPPERFISEWLGGFLPLPHQVCSGDQLYRAFEAWARRSGVRWIDEKAKFTSAAKRYALERVERDEKGVRLDPYLEHKVVQIKDPDVGSGRKADKCWIPRGCGPQNGVTMGEWAADCINSFEAPLRRYLHTRSDSGDEEKSS